MARVRQIFSPEQFPGEQDAGTRKDLQALWDHLFPGVGQGEPHAGYAILAQSPRLALAISQCADAIIQDAKWTQRTDLREVAIQTLNLHYKCDFSFHAHLPIAQRCGISAEQQAALPYWRTSRLFDDDQKLIIEYTQAVIVADVPPALFARMTERFGEAEAVECTVAIGWWALWAMLLNATAPDYRPERAQPLPKDAG